MVHPLSLNLSIHNTRHYTSQAIKQMYVVLLGLDVIGNPYGLAIGVARSVEDLFYEPFQVQFASLVSLHAVLYQFLVKICSISC